MFISEARAEGDAAGGGAGSDAGGGAAAGALVGIVPYLLIFVVFYFMLIRPQQQARKRHLEMVAALKKGDVVVTSGGLIGKVRSVQEDEVRVELAPNVDVRVRRGAIAEVVNKTEPAPANDSKPSE